MLNYNISEASKKAVIKVSYLVVMECDMCFP